MSTVAIEMAQSLAEPFEATEVRFKPQAVKGNRAMAICYIDARCVMDRLDEVFGVGGWQDSYTPLAEGTMLCRLRVKIDGEWIEKTDIGGESEQPDGGDRHKAAVSDALKRAAVKLGIGRYLYRLGIQWVDYDATKKWFVKTPTLPAWALPKHPAQAKPNGVAAAPAKSKASAAVATWHDWLAKRPSLVDINASLPTDFAKATPTDKPFIWTAIQEYAESEGWAFVKETKAFAIKPAAEPIDAMEGA